MSDVTHYARARKWLDDPDSRLPDDARAELNAALAVSTAQRETEKAVTRLTARVETLTSALEIGLQAIAPRPFVQVGDVFVSRDAITHLRPRTIDVLLSQKSGPRPDDDARTDICIGGDAVVVLAGTPAEVAERLGL